MLSLEFISDYVGIAGVILILLAYYYLHRGSMRPDNISYCLYNFFGAGMILFSLLFHWNTSAVIIETAWMLLSLYGIIKVTYKPKQ